MKLEDLSLARFAPLLGDTFEVDLGDGRTLPLVLTEAQDRHPAKRWSGHPQRDLQGDAFSLIFRGPLSCWLPQQMWDFRHPALGAVTLFMVPVGVDSDGYTYEVFFNRLR